MFGVAMVQFPLILFISERFLRFGEKEKIKNTKMSAVFREQIQKTLKRNVLKKS
jgi:hypothetical protein